jgi:thiol-disulfide isomerase/thioredoxin
MKHFPVLIIIALIFITGSCNSVANKEIKSSVDLKHIESADSLLNILNDQYNNGELEMALEGANAGIRKFGQTDELINMQYSILLSLEEYEEALQVFEVIIERLGDSPNIVVDKIRLLRQLDRQDEALQLSLEVDQKYEDKSPYMSLMIADIYSTKGEQDSAIHWLEIANSRGFNEFDYLLSDQFSILHEQEQFQLLVEEMMLSAGIGLPAKEFSIQTTEGELFRLSDNLGKVVLIDFWATWCPPCVAEFPHLDSLYNKYKDHGFSLISISADKSRDAVTDFLARHSPQWAIGFSGDGREDAVVRLYNISSFPTYILVGRNGSINYITSYGGVKLEELIDNLMEI